MKALHFVRKETCDYNNETEARRDPLLLLSVLCCTCALNWMEESGSARIISRRQTDHDGSVQGPQIG